MKKVFYLVLIISLLLSFVGCSRQINYEDLSKLDVQSKKDMVKELKESNGVQYIGKDIEYNMKNMLDKPFLLVGNARLSDYFGYSYKDKDDVYFSVRLTPTLDTSKEIWYLYFSREHWDEFYKALQDNDTLPVYAICKITSAYYIEGQEQIAYGSGVVWE